MIFYLLYWSFSVLLAIIVAVRSSDLHITLRIKYPNGSVRRITVERSEKIKNILTSVKVPDVIGLSLSLDESILTGNCTIESLNLRNGDLLFVIQDEETIKKIGRNRKKILEKMKSRDAMKDSTDVHPFPRLARPPPPKGPCKNIVDLEAKHAQTFKVIPQSKSRVNRISIDPTIFNNLTEIFKCSTVPQHFCAMMFGKIDHKSGYVKVEAVFHLFPQKRNGGSSYDPSHLLNDTTDSHLKDARKVAGFLDLQPVGWCLTHDMRSFPLSGRDIATAAHLQLLNMRDRSFEEADNGLYFTTITIGVDKTSDETVLMAYTISDLAVQMASEGVFTAVTCQPDDRAIVETVENVIDNRSLTTKPDALSFTANVPIVSHRCFLRSNYIRKSDDCNFMRNYLFGNNTKKKLLPFFKKICDFNLLVHIYSLLEEYDEFKDICRCIINADSTNLVFDRLYSKLYTLTTIKYNADR